MITTENLEQAKRLIRKEEHPIIIKAQDEQFNRKILEYGHFDVLLGLELQPQKSSLRQLNSGFNEVLAKIAKANSISLGIDLDAIRKLNKTQQAEVLSRIRQNIFLCRKAGLNLAFYKKEDKLAILSFMLALGASTNQASQTIYF